MRHPRRLFLLATVVAATLWAAAPGSAAAAPPTAGAGPEAVATAYLQARAAAVTAADPAAPLAQLVAPGSGLAARERLIARGVGRNALRLGHLVDTVQTAVTLGDVAVAPDGASATVAAHVVTTITWHTRDGASDVEASGVDHVVTLASGVRGWQITGDDYTDVLTPAYLEDAGAPQALAKRAAQKLESGPSIRVRWLGRDGKGRIRTPGRAAARGQIRFPGRFRTAGVAGGGRAYMDTIVYDRAGAAAYADRYALSYNPGVVRFSADCANFVSQSARGGGMPTKPGTWDAGWWYDARGTSSPSDDQYSLSWINVGKQMGFWNGTRTDWVPGIANLGKGDAVYYDWSGDGVWDHVAMVVGTNAAGQKVIDAHTTDHYHVFWKLGYSTTQYRFARVRPQWIV